MVGMVFSEAKDTSQFQWNTKKSVFFSFCCFSEQNWNRKKSETVRNRKDGIWSLEWKNVKKHAFFDGHPLRKETP